MERGGTVTWSLWIWVMKGEEVEFLKRTGQIPEGIVGG